ncbi:hypothetical protein E4U41_003130 [Claviceps citrina]|nr:hypothetical protein E4U41_003130 [Claviceps citrina]
MPQRSSQRPIISAPLGPVKTSRGPDLIRSEGLELVDSIKDCESGPSTPAVSIASRRSRRISASFLGTAAPSTSPIVAASDITAVTHVQSTKAASKGSFGKRTALLSLSARSLLKQPSRYTLVARSSPVEDEENLEPLAVKPDREPDLKLLGSQKLESRLPRSRTMTVLHGLKKSFSRSSLAAARNSGLDSKTTTPRMGSSLAKRADVVPSPLTFTSSAATPTPTSDTAPSPVASTPRADGRQIDAAQSSEYWSGRFMALQDRFLSENLEDDDSPSQYSSPAEDSQWRDPKLLALGHQSLTSSRNLLTYLAPSNTTSALTTMTTCNPRRRQDDEDDTRRRRIFSHLDSLCRTDEARKSLRLWQQSYARRFGCSTLLLPVECPSETRNGKTMLLGSVGSRFKSIERREGMLKQMPNPGRGAAFGVKPSSSHGVTVC